ncbi:MAG: hypothetical protein H0U66_13565 [Gemmatimonadaceae bacterium]|nr:hypothetical protein [Gemmatimonadaceae bacterium]
MSASAARRDSFVEQRVNLADRRDIDHVYIGGSTVDSALDLLNSVAFATEPLNEQTELSGLFSGHLDFTTNKRDLDISIALYELTSERKYISLTYYMVRASYARERTRRTLLAPDRPQQLDFTSGRLASTKLAKGSRLLTVFTVLKQPNVQISYGTGKDVSLESVADAGAPLSIEWSTRSHLDFPVRR